MTMDRVVYPFSLSNILGLILYVSPPEHPVSWTLPYEVRFYVVIFFVLLATRHYVDVAFLLLGIAQFVATMLASLGIIEQNMFDYVLMSEFSLGLFVGALIARRIVIYPYLLLFSAIAWFLISFSAVYSHPDLVTLSRGVLFGLPAAMLLYSVITLENLGKIKIPAILVGMGDFSYSIYLWHYPLALFVLHRWTQSSDRSGNGLIYIAEVVSTTMAVSIVSYVAIEKPGIQLGRMLTRRRSTGSV